MSREAEPEQTKGLFRRASANGGRSLPLAGLEARLPFKDWGGNASPIFLLSARPGSGRGGEAGQDDGEHAARALDGFDLDAAAVLHDDLTGHIQADAGAAV